MSQNGSSAPASKRPMAGRLTNWVWLAVISERRDQGGGGGSEEKLTYKPERPSDWASCLTTVAYVHKIP